MRMEYLGSTEINVKKEVKVVNRAETDGNKNTFERYRGYLLRGFLLLLVGTTIFSDKANNYVDLTYLKFFIDLDRIDSYSWGTAAPAFLYWELTNAVVPDYKYVAGYMALLQAWVYDHFKDIGGAKSKSYVEEMPRACKYDLTKGQTN
ncbi:unnamed protein product [Trifolium pratense]|uniref:Uncharacterized protein n=1 Tax=Trifolium pratense TaxID=57577 RepID=A0ACB0JE90_TRIPR|nr:unnamed protein product [Trifolium pratense]